MKRKQDKFGIDWFLERHAEAYQQSHDPGGPRTAMEWMACDQSGELAACWPYESGRVPALIHNFSLEQHLAWHRYFYTIDPAFIEGDPETDLPRLGFYEYVLNEASWRNDVYERTAQPTTPRLLTSLPEEHQALVGAIRFPGLFRETAMLQAGKYWKMI